MVNIFVELLFNSLNFTANLQSHYFSDNFHQIGTIFYSYNKIIITD